MGRRGMMGLTIEADCVDGAFVTHELAPDLGG